MRVSLSRACGSLIIGGFHGLRPTASFAKALRAGELGGAVLFKRNLDADVRAVSDLTRELAALDADVPPIVGIDQEGGRVARLKDPFVLVPPLRELATRGDDLCELAAVAQAVELRALGFSSGFSPVLDVNTNAQNPVIGDRAFGDDVATVTRLAVRYGLALQANGVFACGKHYPGHGDTAADSHFDLPVVDRDRASVEATELAPFAAAARAGFAAMMSAHVVFPRIDPDRTATLSRVFCKDILREKMGFRGVLFSDDLEMKALSARMRVEESTVGAIDAGCDALLICSDEDMQRRAHAALVKEAETSPTFRARMEEAAARVHTLRLAYPPRPLSRADLERALPSAEARRFRSAWEHT